MAWGLKTAACWIGNYWQVATTGWASGQEWTATVDVEAIIRNSSGRVPLSPRSVNTDAHNTKILIRNLNRVIQRRTEENVRNYLGSMYRMDLRSGRLKLVYGGEEIAPPDQFEFDTDADGKLMRREIDTTINEKQVKGWYGVLRTGSGGRSSPMRASLVPKGIFRHSRRGWRAQPSRRCRSSRTAWR